MSDATRRWLQAQPWPGNVRQLRQWVERAVLVSSRDTLEIDDFTETARHGRRTAVGAMRCRPSAR